METVAPEDAVVGHVQVQSHGVLLRGHHLTVVPLRQVDASDLMAVGEEQVGAFTCRPEEEVGALELHSAQWQRRDGLGGEPSQIDGLLVRRINYGWAQKESALVMASQISRLAGDSPRKPSVSAA